MTEGKIENQVDPQPESQARITGYKLHSQAEVDAVNLIKSTENGLGDLVDEVRAMPGVDQRMVAIAVTEFQTGFMWLVRSIFQPESRLGPGKRP